MTTNTSRRAFLTGLAATGGWMAGRTATAQAVAGKLKRHDPNLAVLVSDLHVNGLKSEVPTHQYEEACFSKTIAAILALDPLPANVVCFGDIAYHWGQREDYVLAFQLMKPIVDAGIKLTLGMGNHDRRGNFPDRVEITNHQRDFFFTGGPGDGQPMRDDIVRELNGQKVTLRF